MLQMVYVVVGVDPAVTSKKALKIRVSKLQEEDWIGIVTFLEITRYTTHQRSGLKLL